MLIFSKHRSLKVSINARPQDPGGGTGSTVPRRRIVIHDVIVSVEQPREEPALVSHTSSTVQTGQALAENTHLQGCSHDVVGLYAHKGTMCNTDDRVPRKLIKSQYEGGALTPPPPPPRCCRRAPSGDVSSSFFPAHG